MTRSALNLVETEESLQPHDHVELPPSGGYLYHATYFKHLQPIIDAGGLIPGKRANNFGQSYEGHSDDKAFVARGNRASFWASRLADHAEQVHELDFPDLSDEDAVREYEEHSGDPDEQWRDNRKSHSVVMLRFPAVSVPGNPNHPQYVRDIEHDDDYYWSNPAQIPLHGIQIQHPETGEWLSGLDDEENIEDISNSLDNRAESSLEKDPSGYVYDYADPSNHHTKIKDDFEGRALKAQHPDLSGVSSEEPEIPSHVDPHQAETYEDSFGRHQSYNLGYSQGRRNHPPDPRRALNREAFQHGYETGSRSARTGSH